MRMQACRNEMTHLFQALLGFPDAGLEYSKRGSTFHRLFEAEHGACTEGGVHEVKHAGSTTEPSRKG